MSVSMTSSDHIPGFKVTVYLHVEYLKNGASYRDKVTIGQIPDAWRKAVVTPVYKKGSSCDPANYRPISQTSIFCKLMERVIAAELSDYLLSRGVITSHQHGFIAKRSTTTNLLDSLNNGPCQWKTNVLKPLFMLTSLVRLTLYHMKSCG